MNSKPNVVFEESEVPTEWVHQAADDTLIAYLPGFMNEQLEVQVTTGGNLRISGERPIGVDKISRFFKEFPIPSNCDQSKIGANFSGGMLHVKFPKLIVPSDEIHPRRQPETSRAAAAQQAAPPANDTALKRNDTVPQAPPRPPTAAVEERMGDEKNSVAANGSVTEKENLDLKKFESIENYQTRRIRMNMGMNNPRKIMNMILAVLSLVVLLVYLGNVIMWLGTVTIN
ncbi:hypothetical protein GQ457_15G028450 [Hibiscus cannabinus]